MLQISARVMPVICVLLFTVPGVALAADPQFADYVSSFVRNKETFVRYQIECTSVQGAPEYQREMLRMVVKQLDERGRTTPLSPEELDTLSKKAATKGKSLEQVKQELVGKFKSNLSEMAERRTWHQETTYFVTPDLLMIRYFNDYENDNARRKNARQKKLSSRTGGDWVLAQRKPADTSWTGLEPYPYVNHKDPLAWMKADYASMFLLPPFVRSDRLHLNNKYPDLLSTSLGRSGSMAYLGPWNAGSEPCHLFVAPMAESGPDQVAFIMCAFPESAQQNGFPKWIASAGVTQGTAKDLARSVAVKFADLMQAFVNNPEAPQARLNEIGPRGLVSFGQVDKVEGAGWYPRIIRNASFAPVFKSSSLSWTKDWDLGIKLIDSTVVKSILANESMPELKPFELPQGTLFLDLDTGVGGVHGAASEDGIKNLLPGPRPYRWGIILVNVVAVVTIIAVLLFRRKRSA